MAEFPAPMIWVAPFAWECAVWDAPIVDGDEVIVRAGAYLVGLAAADGVVRWRLELPGADLGGQVFALHGEHMVCDVTLDRAWHLVACTRRGEAWRRELGGTVARNGMRIVDGVVHAVVTERSGAAHLLQVDLAKGSERRRALPARVAAPPVLAAPCRRGEHPAWRSTSRRGCRR